MTQPARHRTQISIALMLVLMSILALMLAGILYASRVGAIQDELSLFTGATTEGAAQASRTAHLMFLMFTYTSPLLLAMVLWAVVVLLRYRERHGSQ